jgi:hypothetical protein
MEVALLIALWAICPPADEEARRLIPRNSERAFRLLKNSRMMFQHRPHLQEL